MRQQKYTQAQQVIDTLRTTGGYATLGDLKPWKNISLIPLRCEYLRYKALTPWKNEPLQPVKTSKAFLYGVLLSFYIDDFLFSAS